MGRLAAVIILLCLVGCACQSPVAERASDGWIRRQGGEYSGSQACRVTSIAQRFKGVIAQPVKVAVMNRPELMAFGWPSGQIFLSRGLVENLTDDEIAAVIGHEMGHLLADHHLTSSFALTGQPIPDREAAADDASVQLLTAVHLPSSSMKTALVKVLESQPLQSAARPMLAERIHRLP